jgi:hypothetical protein
VAYTKTTWLDRAVQFATRYTKSGETSSGVTLTADPGTITQAGTLASASLMNKLEQGVQDAHTTADAALRILSINVNTTDWNTVKTTGIYEISNATAANSAVVVMSAYAYGTLIVTKNGFEVSQRYITHAGSREFLRTTFDDGRVWEPWVRVWNSSDIRTTNGYVEWNNGGTWLPVGGAVMTASATVQHTIAGGTANSYITATAFDYVLVGKFLPLGTGEMNITADIALGTDGTTGGYGATLLLYSPPTTGNESITSSWFHPNWQTPLGTVVANTSGTNPTVALGSSSVIESYVNVNVTAFVRDRQPVYLLMAHSASFGGNKYCRIKNATVKYTVQ